LRLTALAFSPDGRVLATGADDGSIGIWDVPTRTLRETFSGHAAGVNALSFSPDGATLYSGSADGSVFVWDVRGLRRLGRPFRFSPVAAPGEGVHVPPTNASTAVAVSPDSSLFVTSPAPNRVTVWRARDEKVLDELRGPCGSVNELEWSHDGRFVAAACARPVVIVWDVRMRRIARLIRLTPGGTLGIAFSPDDRLLATAGLKGIARVFELANGRMIGKFGDPTKTLQAANFSPDGKWLVAAGLGPDIFVWNVAKRRVEHRIHDPHQHVAVKFSPKRPEFAIGNDAGNVEFWDAATGRRVGPTLGGQNGWVLSVTYDPTGSRVITTSDDGKLRLWDVASGKLIGAPLPGAETGGWGTFFPNGKRVIAVFGSGTGVIWNVDPATWKTMACRVAGRELTRAEWKNFLPERGHRSVCA
jgi:WD40 repeat protein